ncbi:MAG: hypothetical protein ACI9MR_003095 [Myxococcota bacterium]
MFAVLVTLLAGCGDTDGAADDTAGTDTAAMIDTTDDSSVDDTSVDDTASDTVIADTTPPGPFTVTPFDFTRINSIGDVNVRRADAMVDFGGGPFASVIMRVELDTTCFPFSLWADDPPPAGHNWPPMCDAFDRNFEIALDMPDGDADPPGLELVRAITPFGGPLDFEVDVTDLANGLPGMHRIRSAISTYSDGAGQVSGSAGGWNVTVHFDVTPGAAPRNVLKVESLFYGSLGPDATVNATFEVPDEVFYTILEYRVTGHGGGDSGCLGPAEEFCRRDHVLSADGVEVFRDDAWRTDCDDLCTLTTEGASFQYCAENPTGSIQSVRASRANWCPGAVTPPWVFDLEAYRVGGTHTFSNEVLPLIAPGGIWVTSVRVTSYGR